jgi:hypothetical protein
VKGLIIRESVWKDPGDKATPSPVHTVGLVLRFFSGKDGELRVILKLAIHFTITGADTFSEGLQRLFLLSSKTLSLSPSMTKTVLSSANSHPEPLPTPHPSSPDDKPLSLPPPCLSTISYNQILMCYFIGLPSSSHR